MTLRINHFDVKRTALVACLAMVGCGASFAQECVADYFYQDKGPHVYYICPDENTPPTMQVEARIDTTSRGPRLKESYYPMEGVGDGFVVMERTYQLEITDSTVMATVWYEESGLSTGGLRPTRGSLMYNLVLLKMPPMNESTSWTYEMERFGRVMQIWEMTVTHTTRDCVQNDQTYPAMPTLIVERRVYDANHQPLPDNNTVSYWVKGVGKVAEYKLTN
ncbi:MAG: hypothetical protein IKT00_12805 [Prevotella sp.]|nr:hypothetical protein [Prevotella sp.]